MRSQLAFLALALTTLPLTTGCGPTGGGQIGGEALQCIRVSATPLQAQETSPFGYTPADILAFAAGDHTHPLVWARGGTSEVTVSVSPTGLSRYVVQEVRDDGSGAEGGGGEWCQDLVEIDAVFGVTTADGAFTESWTGALLVGSSQTARLIREVTPEEIEGSYTVTEVPRESYDDFMVHFTASFEQDESFGEIYGVAHADRADGNSYSKVDIATFGPVPDL